jgi:hypothetical protein
MSTPRPIRPKPLKLRLEGKYSPIEMDREVVRTALMVLVGFFRGTSIL